MIQTNLQISSKDYYLCELTKKIPVQVTIVAIQLPEGYGFLEALSGGEKIIQKYIKKIKTSESIIDFEVTYSTPTVYWTRSVHRLDFPSIYETILESGSMSLLPIRIAHGLQHHDVLSPSRDVLKKLLRTLKSRFTAVKIVSLHSTPGGLQKSLLTTKQNKAFKLAYESGYYEIPRQRKIEELAQQLGIKRVAMQERLRRAELRILTNYAKKS